MQLAVPYLDVNGTEQRGQHIGIWLGIFTGMAALLALDSPPSVGTPVRRRSGSSGSCTSSACSLRTSTSGSRSSTGISQA